MQPPRWREIPVIRTLRPIGPEYPRDSREGSPYFLLRRCTRVRLRSLRCFFLAMRLRRFLMTEPMNYLTDPLETGDPIPQDQMAST